LRRPQKIAVDVAIVGAGPAGLLAAQAAARAGAWTLIIEAKAQVGWPNHCAEWLPGLVLGRGQVPAEAPRARVGELECRAGQTRAVARVAGVVVDRPTWQKALAEEALWWGGSLTCRARALGLDEDGRLLVAGPAGRFAVRAGAVIVADGALSPLARALGLGRQAGAPAINLEVEAGPRPCRPAVEFWPELFGYGWSFPKGATVNIGLGGVTLGRRRLPALLAAWRESLLAQGLIGPGLVRRGGGWLGHAGPRAAFVRGPGQTPLLLCGDAAGLGHPCTGAGLPQAVDSGLLAGAAAAELARGVAGAGPAYQAELTARFGQYLGRGLAARQEAWALWRSDWPAAARRYWPLWPAEAGR